VTSSSRPVAQVLVVVVGLLLLAGLFFAVTRPRTFLVYTDGTGPFAGEILETEVQCGSIIGADGVERWSASRIVDPVPEFLPMSESVDDPANCPEEGPTWTAIVGTVAVLIGGFTVWGVLAIRQPGKPGTTFPP